MHYIFLCSFGWRLRTLNALAIQWLGTKWSFTNSWKYVPELCSHRWAFHIAVVHISLTSWWRSHWYISQITGPLFQHLLFNRLHITIIEVLQQWPHEQYLITLLKNLCSFPPLLRWLLKASGENIQHGDDFVVTGAQCIIPYCIRMKSWMLNESVFGHGYMTLTIQNIE